MKNNFLLTMIVLSMIGTTYADNKSWTGFYAGVNAGAEFNDAQISSNQLGFNSPSETCNKTANFSTYSSGIQFGYLYQFPNAFVTGVEANINFNHDQNYHFSCNSEFNVGVYDRFTFRQQMQSSVKGRLGRSLNGNKSILPYLTAGATVANVSLSYRNEGSDYYDTSTTDLGWLIGAGVEWAFREHWSLRAEYNYVDYGRVMTLDIPTVYGLFDAGGKGKVGLSSNNVMLLINYWI